MNTNVKVNLVNIDIRTDEKSAVSELSCGRRTRNKNHNGENLKLYRGKKYQRDNEE